MIIKRSQILVENKSKPNPEIVKNEQNCRLHLLSTNCFEQKTPTKAPPKFMTPLMVIPPEKDTHKLPKINFYKLMQVTVVILAISILTILFIWFIYRIKRDYKKKKKMKRKNAIRGSSSSNSAFYSALNDSSSKKPLILPPNNIPKFDSKIGKKKSIISPQKKSTQLASNNSPSIVSDGTNVSRKMSTFSTGLSQSSSKLNSVKRIKSFNQKASESPLAKSEPESLRNFRFNNELYDLQTEI